MRKTTRPRTNLQSNHPPLHAPSAIIPLVTCTAFISSNRKWSESSQPWLMETNIQSSSFKMNTPIPSYSKTLRIHQCTRQQYEPKSTTDSDATSQKPMNGSFELDDSYHTNMSLPDIPLINEFVIKSTLPRPRWNTTSLGNGNLQRETHNPNIHI